MGKDNRSSARMPAKFKVEMTHPEHGSVLTNTRDISDRGAFVLTEDEDWPDLQERVKIKVIGLPGEEPSPVESEVVRRENEGVGVKFLTDEDEAELDDDDEEFLNS